MGQPDEAANHHRLPGTRRPHEQETALIACAKALVELRVLKEGGDLPLDVGQHLLGQEDGRVVSPAVDGNIRPVDDLDHGFAGVPPPELSANGHDELPEQDQIVGGGQILLPKFVTMAQIAEEYEVSPIRAVNSDRPNPEPAGRLGAQIAAPEGEPRVAGRQTLPPPCANRSTRLVAATSNFRHCPGQRVAPHPDVGPLADLREVMVQKVRRLNGCKRSA